MTQELTKVEFIPSIEVLTREGWMPVRDLTETSEVCSTSEQTINLDDFHHIIGLETQTETRKLCPVERIGLIANSPVLYWDNVEIVDYDMYPKQLTGSYLEDLLSDALVELVNYPESLAAKIGDSIQVLKDCFLGESTNALSPTKHNQLGLMLLAAGGVEDPSTGISLSSQSMHYTSQSDKFIAWVCDLVEDHDEYFTNNKYEEFELIKLKSNDATNIESHSLASVSTEFLKKLIYIETLMTKPNPNSEGFMDEVFSLYIERSQASTKDSIDYRGPVVSFNIEKSKILIRQGKALRLVNTDYISNSLTSK